MKVTVVAILLAALVDGLATGERGSATHQAVVPKSNGKTFTLNQIENKNFKGPDGPASLIRAYIKYAHKLPDYLLHAMKSDPILRTKFIVFPPVGGGQTGTVQARPERGADSQYGITVKIGTPPQTIPLNLDTGSSDLWTFSTDTNKLQVNGQKLYYPNDSSTSQFLRGETWQIKYGDGAQASGVVYSDKVRIGDTYVKKQAVQVAVNVSSDLAEDNFVSGILGMANSAANTVRPTPQRTYIDNVRDDLALPLFTANLKRQTPGNYNFGYIDRSEYTGNITYIQVDAYSPYWRIIASGYKIGNVTDQRQPIDTIVDTGTSLLLLPDNVVQSYYSRVQGSVLDPRLHMMVFPCTSILPDFYVSIGGYRGRIPGSYMIYGRVTEETCFGGLQSSAELPFSVLGDVFLKAQFVVFDYGHGRVGFANKPLSV